ncbi:hypothetical protein RBU49_13525 [Clostridium sp. MB40-C1]|nr:hypothetical protein [Clostridium sp. MB40-C1]WMJ79877.1 hypothetical protein RBU49_13525 [Clostridium sp. MB40-C1]
MYNNYVVLILAILNGINNILFYAVNIHIENKVNSISEIISMF